MFVSRELFEHTGGFPEIMLMEDIAMSKELKKRSRPAHIHRTVTASSRYWEYHGIMSSILRMWVLRSAYFLGANTYTLAKIYYAKSDVVTGHEQFSSSHPRFR